MKISLHIDRLNVKGLRLSSSERGVLQAAIERELAQLVEADANVSGLQSRSTISAQAPRFKLGQDHGPATIGRQIALSVYSSLSPANNRINDRTGKTAQGKRSGGAL